MPKEIPVERSGFHETIPSLRMSFSELVTVLETINVDTKLIHAKSNGAEFEGLEDIKSAPTRFSGKPLLQISKSNSDGSISFASVEFDIQKTVVNAGKYRGYSAFNPSDNELAKLIFEELIAFSKPSELWVKRIAGWGTWLFAMLIIVGFFNFNGYADNGNAIIGIYDFPPSVIQAVAITNLVLVIIDRVFTKRLPVVYNPRQTFWQQYGQTVIGGIIGVIGTVIATLIIPYFVSK